MFISIQFSKLYEIKECSRRRKLPKFEEKHECEKSTQKNIVCSWLFLLVDKMILYVWPYCPYSTKYIVTSTLNILNKRIVFIPFVVPNKLVLFGCVITPQFNLFFFAHNFLSLLFFLLVSCSTVRLFIRLLSLIRLLFFFWLHLHLTFNRFLICTHRRMQIYTQIYLHRIILQQFCKFIQITNCVASKMTVVDFGRWIKMQTKFNVKSSLHWELSLGLLLVSLSK